MVKIRVPATSANIGSGFDALGIALTMYNEVWMDEHEGTDIESLDEVEVPKGEDNLIYYAAKFLYERCGREFRGLKIRQTNAIPMTRGLGSSSACIIAGLLGANALMGSPLTKNEIVDVANEIEGHPDNTTPALLGGLVTCAIENGKVYSVSVPVAERIRFAAFIPPFELKTSVARRVVPTGFSRQDAIYNLSRSSLLTSSLFSGALENLKIGVQDKIHQPYRLHLIPGAETVFEISEKLGSLGTYISGAGPTIIAMIEEHNLDFAEKAEKMLKENNIDGWKLVVLKSDSEGAVLSIE